jgi:hypothetical protein
MEKVKKVRRKYILNKPFQFGYVSILILLQLCVAVLVGLVISYLYLFVFNHDNLTIQHNYDLFLQWAIVLGTLSIVLIIWGKHVFYFERRRQEIFHAVKSVSEKMINLKSLKMTLQVVLRPCENTSRARVNPQKQEKII